MLLCVHVVYLVIINVNVKVNDRSTKYNLADNSPDILSTICKRNRGDTKKSPVIAIQIHNNYQMSNVLFVAPKTLHIPIVIDLIFSLLMVRFGELLDPVVARSHYR